MSSFLGHVGNYDGLEAEILGLGFLFFPYSSCTKFLYCESEDSSLISADRFLLAVYVLLMTEPSIGLVPGLTLTCISLTWRSGTAHEYYL